MTWQQHVITTQVTEPGTLIPLVLGATQVVLIGDHKQLGPCVSSIAAEAGLARSLFERLLQNGMTSHMLNVQYRKHPDIAKVPPNQYYEGKLRNGDNTLHLKGGQLGLWCLVCVIITPPLHGSCVRLKLHCALIPANHTVLHLQRILT